MNTFTLDTHQIIKRLQSKGFTDQQAEGVVGVIQEIDLEHVATKADVKEVGINLSHRMELLQSQLTIRLGGIVVAGIAVLATVLTLFN